MKNRIEVDLEGITSKDALLQTLGDVFEFGGPNGNHPVMGDGSGWGMGWDGLEDALGALDTGGIWGTAKKFEFPLEITFLNTQNLKKSEPESFTLFHQILDDCISEYAEEEKILTVRFE